MSEDPAGNGSNWFAYCASNPTNAVDPDGQKLTWWQHLRLVLELIGRLLAGEPRPALVGPKKDKTHVVRHLDVGGSGVLAISSLDAYFQIDPLDCMAICADIAGEHELAASIDWLNGIV